MKVALEDCTTEDQLHVRLRDIIASWLALELAEN